VNAPNEQFVAMPFDHSRICQFTGDEQDEPGNRSEDRIVEFIRSVLIDAKRSIEERLEASMLNPASVVDQRSKKSI
jgi:hypothetical protein